MFIKKYEAASLEQALAAIKNELGPSALVLSTKHKRGNWFQKSIVEVTAALEKRTRELAEESFDEDTVNKIFPHRRQEVGFAARTPVTAPVQEKKVERHRSAPVEPVRKSSPKKSVKSPVVSMEPLKYEQQFLDLGFSPGSSTELSKRLSFDYSKTDLNIPSFFEKARAKLVMSYLHTYGLQELIYLPGWVAIGAPGAGKTSLLVKMGLKLRTDEKPVELISCDDRKVMGRSELAAYAKLMQVGFKGEEALRTGRTGTSIPLIDTPPMLCGNEESDGIIQKACQNRRVVLVLDATQRMKEMLRIFEAAAPYEPTAIAMTRLDLIQDRGILFDFLRATHLPLLGVSNGQGLTTSFLQMDSPELARFILQSVPVTEQKKKEFHA